MKYPFILFLLLQVFFAAAQKNGELVGISKPLDPSKPPGWLRRDFPLPKMKAIAADTMPEIAWKCHEFYTSTQLVSNYQYAIFLTLVGDTAQSIDQWIRLGLSRIDKRGDRFIPMAGYEHLPVTGVSVPGAQAYIDWINAGVKERLQYEGHAPWPNYRLPLEGEWLQLSKIYDTSTAEWCSATVQEVKENKWFSKDHWSKPKPVRGGKWLKGPADPKSFHQEVGFRVVMTKLPKGYRPAQY